MNRRVLGVLAAVALAVVGTAVLIGYVRGADERALAGKQLVPTVFVSGFEPVEAGTPLDEIPTEVREIPADVRHPSNVESLADAAELVAAVELLPGEQLLWDRLVEPQDIEQDSPSRVDVPEGFMEVTIPIEADRALGGMIRPGSTVGLVATFEAANILGIGANSGVTNRLGGSTRVVAGPTPVATEPTEFEIQQAEALDAGPGDTIAFVEPDPEEIAPEAISSTHFLLHKVLITELQADQVANAGALVPADDDAPVQAPGGRFLVTFAVRAYDVERVVYAAEFGQIWLARDPSDADESGTRPQTSETILEQIDLPLILPTPDPEAETKLLSATNGSDAGGDAGDEGDEDGAAIVATPTPRAEPTIVQPEATDPSADAADVEPSADETDAQPLLDDGAGPLAEVGDDATSPLPIALEEDES